MNSVEAHFGDLLSSVDLLLEKSGGKQEQADVVADLLGFLAQRMTKLHHERQEEVGSFLRWLEERLGRPVDELTGRGRIEEYYKYSETDLLTTIQKNHPSKVAMSVAEPVRYGATNRARETIREGYQRSMKRLSPLLQQIELTDRLIDLVVYRLYGLTPNEIQLLES